MPVTVGANMMGVIHVSSGHMLTAFPDVCQTPSPVGPVPIPYPNIAMATDAVQTTVTVKCDGEGVCVSGSSFAMSTGDEAGCAPGGLASGVIKGKAEFISYSFDVKMEGKNVCRSFDMMLANSKNTPPMPVLGVPVISS